MTVQELIDLLSEQDPEATVMLATQPSWPLAANLAAVTAHSDAVDYDSEDADDSEAIVWLAQGSEPRDRSPYAPSGAWSA